MGICVYIHIHTHIITILLFIIDEELVCSSTIIHVLQIFVRTSGWRLPDNFHLSSSQHQCSEPAASNRQTFWLEVVECYTSDPVSSLMLHVLMVIELLRKQP